MGAFDIIVEEGKALFTKKPYVTKAQRKAAAELKGVDGPTGTPITEAVVSPPAPAGPTDPKPKPGTPGGSPQA